MDKTSKACLFRIQEADREKLEQLIFQRYPRREWGSFFRFGFRRTQWGLLACFADDLRPVPGDLDRNSHIVEFRARYILRAQQTLKRASLAMGMIHSHPEGAAPLPSRLDDDMDEYFAREFGQYSKGAPYISLIFSRKKDGTVHFTGRAFDHGQWMPVAEMFTIGKILKRERPFVIGGADDGAGQAQIEMPAAPTARLDCLIGRQGSERLRHAKVGIIGCSGAGSPAAHILARAGVGPLVLVDPKRVSSSNHERLHGCRQADLDRDPAPFKIEVLARLIREINPEARITGIVGNILDEEVLDYLLTCDLLLGCTDSFHSRAALGDLSAHYLLTSIDMGVKMRAVENHLTEQLGEIVRNAPWEPCPWCQGRINQSALAYELMTEAERLARRDAAQEAVARGVDGAQYWGGEPPQELTVGYMTSVVGSMAAGYAIGWLTASSAMPHQRFQFDLGWPKLGAVSAETARNPECSCGRTRAWADQARADRSVSRPRHWPAPVVLNTEIPLQKT
jgi:hypothetical protein